jgi:tight adherence protein B
VIVDGIDSILAMQFIIIFMLVVFFIYLIRFNISLNLSRRIRKYSIEPLNNNQTSLFDGLFSIYDKTIIKLSIFFSKSTIATKYSKKYNKYIDYLDDKKPIDYISNKFFISIVFIFIYLFAKILEMSLPNFFEMILVGAIGFYVPDLYNVYRNYMKRKQIEKDLLNAIIMLNNAFKSGRSTMQAIEIVKDELDGPIKEEFKKMHTEISYGLSLETVFERFSKRVNIEEINYITSSLTILNKTGGNIVKVFSSIERSLFSKRKLESELKSLTSSSRAMSKILLFLPLFFVGVILLLNPDYFNPLFDNIIGLTIFFCIILLYVLYAFFVQKVMRVRL